MNSFKQLEGTGDNDDSRHSNSTKNYGNNVSSPVCENIPERKYKEIVEELLVQFQFLQNYIIGCETKFKEYEAITEYPKYESLKILTSNKWRELNPSDISHKFTDLNDNLGQFLNKVFSTMSNMDTAISRLRNENDKLNDQIKTMGIIRATEVDRAKFSSMFPESSLNRSKVETLENVKKKFKKKLKAAEEKLKEVTEEHEIRVEELDKLKEKNKSLTSENKKLTSQITDMNDKCDYTKEFKNIQKELREIHMDVKESTKVKNDLEQYLSKDVRRNSDFKEKESKTEEKIDKCYEQITTLKSDIDILKDYSMSNLTIGERESFNEMQCQVKAFEKEIEVYEEKDKRMKIAMETVRKKLDESVENERTLKEKHEKYEHDLAKLKNENMDLKKEIDKKDKSLKSMTEKLKNYNEMLNNLQDFDETKSRLMQSNASEKTCQDKLNKSNASLKEKYEECENLKKEKIRLLAELDNIKKLKFSGK